MVVDVLEEKMEQEYRVGAMSMLRQINSTKLISKEHSDDAAAVSAADDDNDDDEFNKNRGDDRFTSSSVSSLTYLPGTSLPHCL